MATNGRARRRWPAAKPADAGPFAEWMRMLRLKRRQSQAEVAKAVGVHQMSVSRWESGSATPNGTQLPAIAKWAEVSAEKIVGLIGKG